jgi:hypothetical protein
MRQIMAGLIPGAIVLGTPGGGKSFHYNQEKGGRYYHRCIYFSGKMTTWATFIKIREACKNCDDQSKPHPLIVIDDVQDIITDPSNVDLLRQLCGVRELSHGRRITYTSRSAGPGGDEFTCKSPVLIMGNEIPTEISESQYAVFSRLEAFYYGPSAREIHKFMGRVWKRDHVVYDWIGEHLRLIQRPDARWYDKLANRRLWNPKGWRKWGQNMFIGLDKPTKYASRADENERVKLRIVANLLAEKLPLKRCVELFQQRCKEEKVTGGCRADFFNVKRRYLKSGGEKQ